MPGSFLSQNRSNCKLWGRGGGRTSVFLWKKLTKEYHYQCIAPPRSLDVGGKPDQKKGYNIKHMKEKTKQKKPNKQYITTSD